MGLDKILLTAGILVAQTNMMPLSIIPESYSHSSSKEDSKRERHQETEIFGSRGCGSSTARATLFLPGEKQSITMAVHPMFLLYLDKVPSQSVIVSITEPGVPEPIFYEKLKLERAGLMAISVPADAPELVPGKPYVFTVSLVCNPHRLSMSKTKRVVFQRKLPDSGLLRRLAQTTNGYERAQILAEAGIGYDALAAVYHAYTQQPGAPKSSDGFRQLLLRLGI
ncbi:MAG: DUF928 domain-containing protein [Xenococcaceae cyanobacterium]